MFNVYSENVQYVFEKKKNKTKRKTKKGGKHNRKKKRHTEYVKTDKTVKLVKKMKNK